VVSRGVQSTIGLLTTTTVFGVAIGGVVVLSVVPFVKHAPNPPATGTRTRLGRASAPPSAWPSTR
jgi:hypothetical protein